MLGRSNSSWLQGLPQSSVHGILQARILERVAMPSSRGSSQLKSPTWQVDSLPSEPPGKPENTGVGILSLLQGNFLIQESNWSLLHCRRIIYQLSYPGSPTSITAPVLLLSFKYHSVIQCFVRIYLRLLFCCLVLSWKTSYLTIIKK